MSSTSRIPTPGHITQARLILGDSQTRFGQRLGRSLRQVQRLERGETPGAAELDLALAAILRGLAFEDFQRALHVAAATTTVN
jgi:transcriptional regulator with XRE-family HTH domain